ncbi:MULTISPECIES: hypothetical protein [unclassified Methanoculleus]|jgi:ribosomal protein S27AE|uniref:Uncharacterized protein n=1 Tax=Methanoculleus palmolei TaxID=72612 RepID=A0ABD8A7J4_9EURY|nr:hypothetical protein [Methanoculleus sp. UBA377]WOX55080.1 hypothetical protein R6Y95_06280 [Methanoculleus palmolei]
MSKNKCLNGSPACSHACKHQENRAATSVSESENILVRPRVPDTFACRVARCPDLIEGTNRAGRPHRTCRAAGNKCPGKLKQCPTGWLDQHLSETPNAAKTTACPRCGADSIRTGTVQDGIGATYERYRCLRCGHVIVVQDEGCA